MNTYFKKFIITCALTIPLLGSGMEKNHHGRKIFSYVEQGNIGVLREHLQSKLAQRGKVNLSVTDERGWTPLHHAIHLGNYEIAKLLIEFGADVNAQSDNGATPLCFVGNNKELARLLNNNGAYLHIRDGAKKTPIERAAGTRTEILLNMFPEVNAIAESFIALSQGDDEDRQTLLSDSMIRDELCRSYESGMPESTELDLGEQPIQPTLSQKELNVLFMKALFLEDDFKEAGSLLEKGARIDYQDNLGNRPIHYMAHEGMLDALIWLQNRHADINVRNDKGETPILMAGRKGHYAIVVWFINLHANLNAHGSNQPEFIAYELRRETEEQDEQHGSLDTASDHEQPALELNQQELTPRIEDILTIINQIECLLLKDASDFNLNDIPANLALMIIKNLVPNTQSLSRYCTYYDHLISSENRNRTDFSTLADFLTRSKHQVSLNARGILEQLSNSALLEHINHAPLMARLFAECPDFLLFWLIALLSDYDLPDSSANDENDLDEETVLNFIDNFESIKRSLSEYSPAAIQAAASSHPTLHDASSSSTWIKTALLLSPFGIAGLVGGWKLASLFFGNDIPVPKAATGALDMSQFISKDGELGEPLSSEEMLRIAEKYWSWNIFLVNWAIKYKQS